MGCGADQALKDIKAGSAICACLATATPSSAPASATSQATPTHSSAAPAEPTEESSKSPQHVSSSAPPSKTSEAPRTDMTSAPPTSEAPPMQSHGLTAGQPSQASVSASPCQKSADAVPQCAQPCIQSAALSAAKCAATDYNCQCRSIQAIRQAALGCVTSGCGLDVGIKKVVLAVSALCSCFSTSPTQPSWSQITQTGSGKPATDPDTKIPLPSVTTAPSGTTKASCAPGATADCGAVASSAMSQCTQKCFHSYVLKVGCGLTDWACQCRLATWENLQKPPGPMRHCRVPSRGHPGRDSRRGSSLCMRHGFSAQQ